MIFVRHGESRHHVDGLTGGWTDTSLTPRGREQIAGACVRLRTLDLPRDTRLFSSDLKRALESAQIIGRALALTPEPMWALREIGNGDAAGLTVADACAMANPAPQVRSTDWRPYPNAETYREMAARIAGALEIIAQRGARSAIVVGHEMSGQELLRCWLGLDLDSIAAFELGTASVTEAVINRWGEPALRLR